MADKRPAETDLVDDLAFHCLGGGNEVGRSCHILQYKGKTVMLDAGAHPAYDGLQSLPFYDEFDLSQVDVLLISHFHLDHAGSLPYVMSKTNFRGRVFMTHPTKAIYKWLIQDSVRVGNVHNVPDQLFTEQDHLSSFQRIEPIDYHTTVTHSGISITPYHAGHVLGGAMFMVEIAGLKMLFTGDYSREDDRHLVSAEVPPTKPDVLICESTYGTASHMPRLEREQRLMQLTTDILNRGGRVLMPVFALGRAQELLLILDEYWEHHAKYQSYPIYYASNLARKCMDVYRTYINTMNDKIKKAMFEGEGRNPWDFKWVRSLKNIDRFEDVGGCVMLASPGMLQNGPSRALLERWAPESKNGLIITGYSVEGTMAKTIVNEPPEIPAVMTATRGVGRQRGDGDAQVMVPRRLSIDELSFAAHVDYGENSAFIEEVGAKHIILVHGEKHNMGRLKSALLSKNAERKEADKWKVYSPMNCSELRIPFQGVKIARVVGKLALKPPPSPSTDPNQEPTLLTGILVQKDFKLSLMAPSDLREYAGLTTTVVTCKQRVPMHAASLGLIRWTLEAMFGVLVDLEDDAEVVEQPKVVEEEEDDEDYDPEKDIAMTQEPEAEPEAETEAEKPAAASAVSGKKFRIMDSVTVRCKKGAVELEWEGNLLNDGVADAVLAILLNLESSPAAVKQSHKEHTHAHDHDEPTKLSRPSPHAHITPQQRLQRVLMFLEAQFGDCVSPLPPPDLPSSSSNPEIKSEDQDMQETKTKFLQHDLAAFEPGVMITIENPPLVAKVRFSDLEVECKSEAFRMRVKSVVERAVETVAPFVDERSLF